MTAVLVIGRVIEYRRKRASRVIALPVSRSRCPRASKYNEPALAGHRRHHPGDIRRVDVGLQRLGGLGEAARRHAHGFGRGGCEVLGRGGQRQGQARDGNQGGSNIHAALQSDGIQGRVSHPIIISRRTRSPPGSWWQPRTARSPANGAVHAGTAGRMRRGFRPRLPDPASRFGRTARGRMPGQRPEVGCGDRDVVTARGGTSGSRRYGAQRDGSRTAGRYRGEEIVLKRLTVIGIALMIGVTMAPAPVAGQDTSQWRDRIGTAR